MGFSSTEQLPTYQYGVTDLSPRERAKVKRSRRRRDRGILDGSRYGKRRKCAVEVGVILSRRASVAARAMKNEISDYFDLDATQVA